MGLVYVICHVLPRWNVDREGSSRCAMQVPPSYRGLVCNCDGSVLLMPRAARHSTVQTWWFGSAENRCLDRALER